MNQSEARVSSVRHNQPITRSILSMHHHHHHRTQSVKDHTFIYTLKQCWTVSSWTVSSWTVSSWTVSSQISPLISILSILLGYPTHSYIHTPHDHTTSSHLQPTSISTQYSPHTIYLHCHVYTPRHSDKFDQNQACHLYITTNPNKHVIYISQPIPISMSSIYHNQSQ